MASHRGTYLIGTCVHNACGSVYQCTVMYTMSAIDILLLRFEYVCVVIGTFVLLLHLLLFDVFLSHPSC